MRMTWIFTLLAAILVAGPLAAEGPVALKDDPRLQTKVTLALGCEPVSTLAETLKKATGVNITVRKDIADLNVTAYTTDTPAWVAMSRVALILGCNWEVKGDAPGKYGYTLFRPLKKEQEADALRQTYWNDQDRKFRDTIEDAIKMVDADAKTLREEARKNPEQVVRNLMFKDTLQDLACFTKAQRDNIWAQIQTSPLAETRIPFHELPPSLQERFRKRVDERHQNRPDGNPGSEGIEKRELIISRGGGYGSPRISALPLQSRLAFFGLSGIGGTAGLGVASPDRQLSNGERRELAAAGIDPSFIKPLSVDFADPESKTKRVKVIWAGEGETEAKDRADVVSMQTTMSVTMPGKRYWHSFDQVLESASRMFKVSIFAQDFICRHRNGTSNRTSFPDDADEALDEICREFGYEKAYDREGCVVLRSTTWYMDEAAETPKRLVLRWMDAKKSQGRLRFKDYLEITRELDNFRIESLSSARVDGEMPLSSEVMHMGANTDRVRLASMLTAEQLKRAYQDGVSYRWMKSDQQQQFAYLLCCERPDLSILEMHTCLFGMQETPGVEERTSPDQHEEDRVVFTYTFRPGDTTGFTMELPKAD